MLLGCEKEILLRKWFGSAAGQLRTPQREHCRKPTLEVGVFEQRRYSASIVRVLVYATSEACKNKKRCHNDDFLAQLQHWLQKAYCRSCYVSSRFSEALVQKRFKSKWQH